MCQIALGCETSVDGYKVLVLYASSDRLTIKYTRKDAIADYDAAHGFAYGYAIHLENVCVDANLLALYQAIERCRAT